MTTNSTLPPDALACLADVVSHGGNILEALHERKRLAIERDTIDAQEAGQEGIPSDSYTRHANETFWQREIDVFNRMVRQAEVAINAGAAQ